MKLGIGKLLGMQEYMYPDEIVLNVDTSDIILELKQMPKDDATMFIKQVKDGMKESQDRVNNFILECVKNGLC